jgi:CubicO group peptidase (beta-lactamase class C family)
MRLCMLRFVGITLVICGAACTLRAQTAPTMSPEIEQHISHVTAGLVPAIVIKDAPNQAHTLAERMAALHVPGVSIAVIHNGALQWAQGFGVCSVGGSAVTADTLFQAGSISKPVAAMGTMHLVQQGKLSLDADVNTKLTSWKLPGDPKANGKPVTLRELLTHTGGTTVHGFPGYAAGEPIPTLVQVLNGEKPANTPAIRIEAEPGARWNYSGGGFTIMQQLVVDVTHEPYPKFLRDNVLEPIGMTHSTYDQPLPADRRASAATPYEADGKPVSGGAHTYPEMAAAGLWTTPTDLSRYALEVVVSLQGKSNRVLSAETTRDMLKSGMGHWGLGLEIGGSASKPYFSHGGVNEGFESLFVAYEDGSEGAFIMTNAQGGSALADEIMHSIAAEYNWPDYHPTVRTVVPVDAKVLATYPGRYELEPTFSLVITLEDGHLAVEPTGQPKFSLFAASPTRYFLTVVDAELEFVKDDQGKVVSLVLHQGGHDQKAVRK